jgi:hypothetical protein
MYTPTKREYVPNPAIAKREAASAIQTITTAEGNILPALLWDDGSPVEEEHLEEYFTQRYAELEHEMLDFEWEEFIQSKIDEYYEQ